MSAGKGSKPRPYHGERFRDNYERIFPRRTDEPHSLGEIVDGAECLGDGAFHLIDQHEEELREEE